MNQSQRFITNQLIVEGPDCAGKTTFIEEVHRLTNYRWNIQDRSALSMLVYAKLYGRDTFFEVERLNRQIKNLNNRFVIIMPPWDEIGRRFSDRGDPIQNLYSLKKVYRLFEECAEEFKNFPNVYVINSVNTKECAKSLISDLNCVEQMCLKDIADYVKNYADSFPKKEASCIEFSFYDDGKFRDVILDDLRYEPERIYYNSILEKLKNKIYRELSGKNEHNRKEDQDSRRFIYTSDTCISLIHFIYRNDILDCHCVLRSSNVGDTLRYDLNFIYYLASIACKKILSRETTCRFRINVNSAHIIM